MKIVYSGQCLEYAAPGHPETPQRVKSAADFLSDLNYEFIEPETCSDEQLLLVHTKSLVDKVNKSNFFSLDSPALKNIYHYAKLAVGGAIKAGEEYAFSLMRPPGHHAGVNSLGGFCYFNNLAVAVAYLGKKTLILDIDGHHGNGTQNIFEGSNQVTYLSLHKRGYPGTGRHSRKNCFNHQFPGSVDDGKYLQTFDNMLGMIDGKFQLVAVSAGFDAYKKDPLASLNLSSNCYREIGRRIQQLGPPVFCVLEGGYVSEKLGENIHELIQGIEGG